MNGTRILAAVIVGSALVGGACILLIRGKDGIRKDEPAEASSPANLPKSRPDPAPATGRELIAGHTWGQKADGR